MSEVVKYTVEAVVGDIFTEFHIKPPVELGRLVGLPRPQFFGAHGPDTLDFHSIVEEKDGASIVTLESWTFGGGGSTYTVESYETAVADHLDRLAAEDAAAATQQ